MKRPDVRIVHEPYTPRPPMLENLRYSVDVYAVDVSRIEEVVARVGDLTVARAAYAAAVDRYPGKLVMLREKARVLRRSDRPDGGAA